MAQTYFLKNIPAPVRSLIRPMLVLSLGLHALILFAPLQGEKKPEPLKQEEKEVKVVRLPTVRSSPKPAAVKRRTPTRKITNPRRTPRATPAPVTQNRSTDTSPVPDVQAAKDPFADFPHHPNATTGCYDKEFCREIKGAKINDVLSYFQKALPGKKFSVSVVTNEPGKKVLDVTKGEQTQVLTIFQDGSNTIYALAPDAFASLKELQGAAEIPGEFFEMLEELPSVQAASEGDPSVNNTIPTPDDFEQPQLFFKSTGAVTDGFADNPEYLDRMAGSPRIAGGGEEPRYFFQTFFEQRLSEIFDEVTPDGEYGGGTLYRLKKGSSTVYLNLVPKKGSPPDTIVVIWTSSPK